MTPDGIQPGGVYLIGRGCGVPYEWAPITIRVIRAQPAGDRASGAWVYGYQLDDLYEATAVRDIYVGIVAGMQPISVPAFLAPPVRRARNERPAIPRPRPATDTTTTSVRRTR